MKGLSSWCRVLTIAFTFCPNVFAFQAVPAISAGSYLGIGVQEVDAQRASALQLKEERGVEVTRVAEDGPAAKAGFKTGDVLLEYNGQIVQGVEQLMRLVRETPSGRTVHLGVWRAGSNQEISLTTADRRVVTIREFDAAEEGKPPVVAPVLGVDVEPLDPQLAKFFGVRDGVLVRTVVRNTAADRAGLKAGDVIQRVNDFKTASVQDVVTAVLAARKRKAVAIQIVREKHELTIQVNLDEVNSGAGNLPQPIVRQ